MKKICLLVAFVMVCLKICGVVVAVNDDAVNVVSFASDTYALDINKTETVKFWAVIESKHELSRGEATVYDENERIAALEHTSENIYEGFADIFETDTAAKTYTLCINGEKSLEYKISFHAEFNDAAIEITDEVWNGVESYEQLLFEQDCTHARIINAMYCYLSMSDDVLNVRYEDNETVVFQVIAGIDNIYTMYEGETESAQEKTEEYAEFAEELKSADAYIGKADIAVYAPYYGYDSNFTYGYLDQAKQLEKSTGGTAVGYYGDDAGVESFKHWDEYGYILVDSHGSNYNGGGYICIPAPGDYDQQDIADGHLVQAGRSVYMRGTFFEKYCESLPNTVVYTGICYGLAADNLYAPLLRHGASFVCGYDNSVSFKYDSSILQSFNHLVSSINARTNQYYTVGEAYNATVEACGAFDPFGSGKANFVCYGNKDAYAVLAAIKLDSLGIASETTRLYHNNTLQLYDSPTPKNANRYFCEWSVDNENIGSIDENGLLTTKELDGKITAMCKAVDLFYPNAPVSVVAKKTITVQGKMPVSGVEVDKASINTFVGNEPVSLTATVYPENASNKAVSWSTKNANIAKIEDGCVVAMSAGETELTVKTLDGGYTASTTVIVYDVNSALNCAGKSLSFDNSSMYSWQVDVAEDGRVSARSTNVNVRSSDSIISLDAGAMHAGDSVSFDWRVSSEEEYDNLSFYVNGQSVLPVSSIYGITEWVTVTYTLPAESNVTVFSWSYSKDRNVDANNDCGWIDNVQLIPAGALPTIEPTPSPYLLRGDANKDGTVNTGDAATILKFCSGVLTERDISMANADFNEDANVNTGDAAAILKYIAMS